MNLNYNKMYRKAINELQQEQYNKRLYEIRKEEERINDYGYTNSYIIRNGRAVTLGMVIAIGSLFWIGKSCEGKDKNYNPKIEHLEDKIRGR